jgi:hypothetical protein
MAHLLLRWQQLVEMPAPSSRVHLAFAVAAHPRPIEDRLDPATDARCCLRLGAPERLQHLHDEGGVDCGHRQVADEGIDVGLERVGPLLSMFCIPPTGLMAGDDGRATVPERHDLCASSEGGFALLPARLDRVDVSGDVLPTSLGLCARLRETHRGVGAEAAIPRLAAHREAEDPGASTARRHTQVEATAVRVVTGRLGGVYPNRRQSMKRPRHRSVRRNPCACPCSADRCYPTLADMSRHQWRQKY